MNCIKSENCYCDIVKESVTEKDIFKTVYLKIYDYN